MPSGNCTRPAAYREQEVGVAFGPMGILEHCDVGTLTRRIDADQVVRVVPSSADPGTELNAALDETSATIPKVLDGPVRHMR